MTDYVYGVAHLKSDGELDHYFQHINLGEAERDMRNCNREGLACHVVRRPLTVNWERVPERPAVRPRPTYGGSRAVSQQVSGNDGGVS